MANIFEYTKPFFGLNQQGSAQHPKEVTLIVISWVPKGKGEPVLSNAEIEALFFGQTDSVSNWVEKASRGRYRLLPHPTHPVIGPIESKYWWPFYWRNATRGSYDPTTGTWGSNYVKDRLTAEEWSNNPYKVPPSIESDNYYKNAEGVVYYLDAEGYIGGHTHSWAEAIREAAKQIDFKELKKNGDSVLSVDEAAVVVVKAQASTFGTRCSVTGSDVPKTVLKVGGVEIHTVCELYAGTPVTTGDLAVAVEEVIHLTLNYADQYPDGQYLVDTDPARSRQLSLSDAGHRPVHADAFHRLKWGWCNPILASVSREYTLHDVESSGDVLIIPSLLEGREGEFFLVENRWRGVSYDRHRSNHWGEGLAIWHCIQDSALAYSWARRAVLLRRVDPSFAGNTLQSEQMALFDGTMPAKSYRLDDTSTPQNLRFRNDVRSGISIFNISPAGPSMTLRVHRTSAIPISRYQVMWSHWHHTGHIKVFFSGGGYHEFGNLPTAAYRTMLDTLRKEVPVYFDPNQNILVTSHEQVGEEEDGLI